MSRGNYILILALSMMCILKLNAQTWHVYTISNSNSPHNGYYAMAIDTANNKYFDWLIGSGDKTVFFNNDTVWTSRNNQYMTSTFNARSMCFDKNNVLWESTSNFDAYSLSGGISGTWQRYNYTTTGVSELSGINDIAVDRLNNKWFACFGGLVKYNDTVFTVMDTINSGLPFEPVYKVAIDKNNAVWLAGGTAGNSKLARYDGHSWQTVALPGFSAMQIVRMVTDSAGMIWIGRGATYLGGLYKYDGSGWFNYTTSNSSIPTDGISVIAIDKSNNLWTSFATGIARFDGSSWTVFDASAGYPGGGYGAIQADRYNNIWNCAADGVVIFNENGIVGIDQVNDQLQHFKVYPNPCSDILNIELPEASDRNVYLTIESILGQTLQTYVLLSTQKSLEIYTDELDPGVYFLYLHTASGIACKKIIKR